LRCVTVPYSTIASGGAYDETLVDLAEDMSSPDTFSTTGIERMRAWAEGNGYEVTVASHNSRRFFDPFEIRRASESEEEYEVAQGSDVTPSSDSRVVLQASDETGWLGLKVGDTLTLLFEGGSVCPSAISPNIARADTSIISDATDASLMLAPSSSFCTRFTIRARSCTSLVRSGVVLPNVRVSHSNLSSSVTRIRT
jgi:hypothetical protein